VTGACNSATPVPRDRFPRETRFSFLMNDEMSAAGSPIQRCRRRLEVQRLCVDSAYVDGRTGVSRRSAERGSVARFSCFRNADAQSAHFVEESRPGDSE
jgi:hypothetical protein